MNVKRSLIVPGDYQHVSIVQSIHLFNILQRVDGLVGLTCDSRNPLGDSFRSLDVIGADLHDAASRVGKEQVVFAILLVDDHVERQIAVSKLGQSRTADFATAFKFLQRELHQRRALEAGQQMRLAVDREGNESLQVGRVFVAAMSTVEDLDVDALICLEKREYEFAYVGLPCSAGPSRYQDLTFAECDVGDRLIAIGCGCVARPACPPGDLAT